MKETEILAWVQFFAKSPCLILQVPLAILLHTLQLMRHSVLILHCNFNINIFSLISLSILHIKLKKFLTDLNNYI
jgi:hypothetical protein